MKDNNDSGFNEKNNREYKNIIENTKKDKNDNYWDRNNIFIKVILILLFIFIISGVSYYIYLWFINR